MRSPAGPPAWGSGGGRPGAVDAQVSVRLSSDSFEALAAKSCRHDQLRMESRSPPRAKQHRETKRAVGRAGVCTSHRSAEPSSSSTAKRSPPASRETRPTVLRSAGRPPSASLTRCASRRFRIVAASRSSSASGTTSSILRGGSAQPRRRVTQTAATPRLAGVSGWPAATPLT